MRKILLFDCDGIAWATFHALGTPLSHEGTPTSVIHGFLNSVFANQRFELADHVVFAWDSGNSLREKIFPGYKAKRKAEKEKYTPEEKVINDQRRIQFSLLKDEILGRLGFSNVFYQDGYEGDDIIASIVRQYSRTHLIKIVARDKDLYQLLNKNVTMFDPVKGKVMTSRLIKKTYGIEPYQFADVKALCGCTTDEVPGVKNIGEIKALQYVRGELKFTSKAYADIQNNSSVIELTRKLTTLPLEGVTPFKIKIDSCMENKLKMVARKYGLRSFVTDARLSDYRRVFCDKTSRYANTTSGEASSAGSVAEKEHAREDGRGLGEFGNNLSDF